MMKNKITFERHNYVRNADELNAAQAYLFQDDVAVIGRSNFDALLLNRIKMPPLPLLMSNREQRMAMQKPWFLKRCLASAIVKCNDFKCMIEHAIQQEKQKCMLLFNWQMLLQPPLPHEHVEENPMTMQEFDAWCAQT